MSQRNFPHPVLGITNDYNESSSFEIYFDNEQSGTKDDGDLFYKDLKYKINNKTIEQLIKDRKAIALCEISCPATLYSRFIPITFDGILHTIKPQEVFGQIKLVGKIIAIDDLINFKFNDLNSNYYDNETFNIKTSDILAHSEELTHNYHPKYIEDTLIDDKTLFQYKKADRPRQRTKVELTSSSVDIILSHEDHASYKNLEHSGKLSLNSLIFLHPILTLLVQKALKDDLNFDWSDAVLQAIDEFNIEDDHPQIDAILDGVNKILKRDNITYDEAAKEVG